MFRVFVVFIFFNIYKDDILVYLFYEVDVVLLVKKLKKLVYRKIIDFV